MLGVPRDCDLCPLPMHCVQSMEADSINLEEQLMDMQAQNELLGEQLKVGQGHFIWRRGEGLPLAREGRCVCF